MTGRGARILDSLARAGAFVPAAATWVALALVPAFAVPQAFRIFEESKVLLLRVLALPALLFAVATLTRARRLGTAGVALVTFLVASTIAAFCTELPALALPGDYLRQGGLLTDLALAGVFLGAATLARHPSARGLALDLCLAGGVASALVAVLAYTPWRPYFTDVASARAAGLAGGPTYFGAWMAALVPLALAQRERRGFALFAALAFLGVIASGSRLAFAATLVGTALVLLREPRARRARPLLFGGLLLIAVAAVALSPLREFLPPDVLPTRLADLTQPRELGVRVQLYSEAFAAIVAEPARLWFGHGPDAIGSRFTAFVSEPLQTALGAATRVDRFHSELLDLVFTRGVFAAAAFVVLLIAAWRARARTAADDAMEIGLRGFALVLVITTLFAVAGIAEKAALFFAFGLLAQRDRAATNLVLPPWLVPALQGGVVASTLFATNTAWALLVAAPIAWMLPGVGLLRFVPFLLPSAAIAGAWLVAGDSIDPAYLPFHGQAGADSARLALCAFLALAALLFAGSLRAAPALDARPSRLRIVGLVAAALVAALLVRDDVARACADVDVGVASVVQLRGGQPGAAAKLLERAVEHTPEVARTRVGRALALVDVARSAPAQERIHLATTIGTEIGLARLIQPRDGYTLALSALCVMRLARLLPEGADEFAQLANQLADEALANAPQAVPVLEIAAEARILLHRTREAADLADHALRIDATRRSAHVMRARAAAQDEDLETASTHYAQALVRGAAPTEARAALAYAAMSKADAKDAAALIIDLLDAVDDGADLDVAGARPLLVFVTWHDFTAAFAEAARLAPERRQRLREVESAMAF